MGNRKSLLMMLVIGAAVYGSISLWIMGMAYGDIGIGLASIGGHSVLLIGGAILGAGVGFLLFPIVEMVVKMVLSALAGDRGALLGLVISVIASIFCALQIWRGTGGNISLTIFGAFVWFFVPFYIYNWVYEVFRED